ncbi:MAG: hypothetical protein ACRDBL_10985 [Rhabdaerophilum sp.]
MVQKLCKADTSLCRNHIARLIDVVNFQRKMIQIQGQRQELDGAVRGQSNDRAIQVGFVRKWRTRQDSNL